MKLYKLSDQNYETCNHTTWGENVTHSGTGEGELCGPGWIHAYTDPLLAALLNPIHAAIRSPVLWEADGEVGLTDYGLKVGCKSLTTIRIIELPKFSTNQRVAFGIFCVFAVYTAPAPKFTIWANNWLSGKDRTPAAAAAAARAAAWAAAAAWEAKDTAANNIDLCAIARKAYEMEGK